MIFVNFKTYEPGIGEAASHLAKICFQVAQATGVKIWPVVSATDLGWGKGEVWVQHVDDIDYGPNTGRILPAAVKAGGAVGTILNHSECKLSVPVVRATVVRCHKLGLKTLVCCESLEEGQALVAEAAARPDFLAYEPPELIGSQTTSVATAQPAVIKDFISQITTLPVLVGAGIHSAEDVQISLKLGAKGILVASSVVLADDPQKELLKLAAVFKNG
ncbi:triose-phosphate isomerase [Candidatus Shapirobacteria bacterium CG09_land_8_20_14_0_10_49_15]|uniref:Triose-phosphate isomerase n=2 Tax=Candidatus Shapironibacteriota TaxID=1752721 RepID=A0A2M8L7U4_9BACT|nr:MAG: triose-phosphate isomerase [Candidatus Shapirobacteria bacterium CG09_land_8_20_14_0_10_49_15]PJE70311.1 MAG: triose-phosphate isomerase [Candidatus Shapirobacteria bacterium CG10_big_fil_rev_8_21_14_0_10_48_15]